MRKKEEKKGLPILSLYKEHFAGSIMLVNPHRTDVAYINRTTEFIRKACSNLLG